MLRTNANGDTPTCHLQRHTVGKHLINMKRLGSFGIKIVRCDGMSVVMKGGVLLSGIDNWRLGVGCVPS